MKRSLGSWIDAVGLVETPIALSLVTRSSGDIAPLLMFIVSSTDPRFTLNDCPSKSSEVSISWIFIANVLKVKTVSLS